jgi:hypothetical protein
MKQQKIIRTTLIVGVTLSGLVGLRSMAQQNKDTVKVPGGLALSEFKGYENWLSVSLSHTDSSNVMRLIVGNPVTIEAYRAGVPGNGKPFPEGSRMAKILWVQKKITTPPFSATGPDTVPGALKELEFIVKDSKRFPDTHGWGYAAFNYDAAADKLTPVTAADHPPQANDAKCGAACHAMTPSTDYIFTAYPKR